MSEGAGAAEALSRELGESLSAGLTGLLARLDPAQPGALDQLIAAAQNDLRRIARRERLSMGAGETLSTTALVNEAYLKLAGARLPENVDRRLFFGIAARCMRQVLVDHFRAARADKRGGGALALSLSAAEDLPVEGVLDLVELDAALAALEKVSARAAEVVQLRYFAGLTDREIAELLQVNEVTVRRDWLKARGWLFGFLGGAPA